MKPVTAFAASILLLSALTGLVVPGPAAQGRQRGSFGAAPANEASDVDLGALRLPKGFEIAVYASGVAGARSMTRGDDGTLFVGTRERGNVYAVVDRDGDYRADDVITLASNLNQPNGVAFRDGALYVAEISKVTRYDGALDLTRRPRGGAPALRATVINDTFPSDRAHGWKYIAFGPDGLLYVPVGAPGNVVERPDPYSSILRMKPDGTGLEVFARGVRNTVGFTWHPQTGEMWFTDNGRDALGDDRPHDELNRAPRPGLHFGYPYCHEGTILDPEFGKGKSCGSYEAPAERLGPHVAALGLAFYTGAMFPAEYRGQLFIAQHGSWNRSPQVDHTGYRVMVARLDGTNVVGYEPFIEGWLQRGEGSSLKREAWGRPVDVLVLPDGSMLISDDRASVIYRVTYRG